VGAIFNLQEPGEHPSCGDGIDDKVGFSYNPEVFNNSGIAYYNYHWQDLKVTNSKQVLMICQQMEDFTQKKGQRIFVHCHAGQGRTGIICASYLFYAGVANSAEHAIRLFKEQRLSSGALKRKRD
jgi:protein tyrosine phosphatase domain-containing protein 1